MREERKIWIALPREVERWWRERSQMRLTVRQPNRIRQMECSIPPAGSSSFCREPFLARLPDKLLIAAGAGFYGRMG
jgi:hypothetical protein